MTQGQDDLVLFTGNNVVYTVANNGTQFVDAVQEASSFCGANEYCFSANVNGDAYDDLVSYNRGTGQVHVALRGYFCGTE